jgi:hypothetical protein
MKARVDGVRGVVWIDPSSVSKGEVRHDEFPDSYYQYFERIIICFKGVYDLSLEEWVDGFKRDANPDQEIAIWVFFGERFAKIIDEENLDESDRRELFRLLMSVMNGGAERAVKHGDYHGVIRNRVKEFVTRLVAPSEESPN